MKNIFKVSFLIITVFILCAVLVACTGNSEATTASEISTSVTPQTTTPATTPTVETTLVTTPASPSLIIPESYQALYLPGAMNGLSSSTGAYSGALTQGVKEYKKTDVAQQTFTVFETSDEYQYHSTEKAAVYPYDVDVYRSSAFEIEVNSETGTIVWFYGLGHQIKPANCPIFNSESTEKDYIAYAKSILSALASESLDQYRVTVKTSLMYDGEKDSPYYRISFEKTISGIPCRGEYRIGIFEDGSIEFFSLRVNQEGFAPFENLVIDKAKLDQIVMANYKLDTALLNVLSREEPEHCLYVEDGVLWAQSWIDFRYEGRTNSDGYKPEMQGSLCYMIKLAEVQTPSADKVTAH